MEEIIIKGNNGTIRFDTNSKSDKLRVTAVDDKGHADSHYVLRLLFCGLGSRYSDTGWTCEWQ